MFIHKKKQAVMNLLHLD